MNTFYDRPFKVHRIFCPAINGGSWETNPVAAYTNSLILNSKVLVPQYGIIEDIQALEVFREAMPGYDVIGFDSASNNPWYSEDALHCRTMGIFDPNMIHISHKSIRDQEVMNNGEIEVIAEVVGYGDSLDIESVSLFWKYSAEDGPFIEISMTQFSDEYFKVFFPILNSNTLIEYYIEIHYC